MSITSQSRPRVTPPSIGVNLPTRLDVRGEETTNRNRISVPGDSQAQSARLFCFFAMLVRVGNHFHGSENESDMRCLGDAPPCFAFRWPADQDFVRFDVASQGTTGIVDHGPAQAVQQKPGCFVTASHLPLELGSAHAGRMSGHQVGRPEPFPQGKVGAVQHGARRCRCLASAVLAFESEAPRLDPEVPSAAFGADKAVRPSTLSQVFKACLFLGKEFSKLFQRLGKIGPSHPPV